MTLYRVKDKDKNYEYIKKEDGNSVINWFEKFDLTQINKIKLDPNCFSSADKIGDIMKNPEGEKIHFKIFWRNGGAPEIWHDENDDIRRCRKTQKSGNSKRTH